MLRFVSLLTPHVTQRKGLKLIERFGVHTLLPIEVIESKIGVTFRYTILYAYLVYNTIQYKIYTVFTPHDNRLKSYLSQEMYLLQAHFIEKFTQRQQKSQNQAIPIRVVREPEFFGEASAPAAALFKSRIPKTLDKKNFQEKKFSKTFS